MSRLGSRDDRRVCDEWEVDAWIGNEVGLELVQVDIERAVEAERSGNGGDDWWILAYAKSTRSEGSIP